MVFSFLIAAQIQLRKGVITPAEWNMLLRGVGTAAGSGGSAGGMTYSLLQLTIQYSPLIDLAIFIYLLKYSYTWCGMGLSHAVARVRDARRISTCVSGLHT